MAQKRTKPHPSISEHRVLFGRARLNACPSFSHSLMLVSVITSRLTVWPLISDSRSLSLTPWTSLRWTITTSSSFGRNSCESVMLFTATSRRTMMPNPAAILNFPTRTWLIIILLDILCILSSGSVSEITLPLNTTSSLTWASTPPLLHETRTILTMLYIFELCSRRSKPILLQNMFYMIQERQEVEDRTISCFRPRKSCFRLPRPYLNRLGFGLSALLTIFPQAPQHLVLTL